MSKPRALIAGRIWSVSILALFLAVCPVVKAAAQDTPVKKGPLDRSAFREFTPGIHIDWTRFRVALDARVVLRQGPLELVACSPRTREHESILVVHARPLLIFQSLGLIGLSPGSPARYDSKTEVWSPPHGSALKISVQYEKDGQRIVEPVEAWLRDNKTKKTPEAIPWVFAGSRRTDSGRYAADSEGTVVALVDFESALVSIGALRSADNELLWVSARTESIPPIGTPCTILIESAESYEQESGPLVVDLVGAGVLKRNGKAIPARTVKECIAAGRTVEVRIPTSLPTESVDRGLKNLDRVGVPRTSYKIRHVDDTSSTPK